MKQHTIASIPSISTVVTLIALASLCDGVESKDGSKNTDCNNESVDCAEKVFQIRWQVFQIILFVVDLPCLLLFTFVFACYCYIREEQGLHGWIVLAVTGSLALRFGVVFLTNLPVLYFDWDYENHFVDICLAFGVLHHFSYLMCYCWALVLAFDLWRRVRTVMQKTIAGNERRRFGAYCAFGFGFPLLNVVLAAILEWGVDDSTGIVKPSYHQRCRVGKSYNYYIGIPNGILVAANLTLLAVGFYFLWRAKKATGRVGGTGGAIQRNLAGLMVKMFVLMGGLTIADFVLQFTGIYNLNPYVKIPIDFMCRVGHAVGFVWVFVFTGHAKEHLRIKYPESFGKVFDALAKGTTSEAGTSNSAVPASVDGLGPTTTAV